MSIDLDAIRARCEALPAGPWFWIERPAGDVEFVDLSGDYVSWTIGDGHVSMVLDFLSDARQDIPDLLAEVERLEGTLAGLRLCMNLGCKVIFHADEVCPACHKEPR